MSPGVRILLIAASYLAASFGAGCALSLGMLCLIRSQSSELLRIVDSPDLKLLMAMIAVSSGFTAVLALLAAMPMILGATRDALFLVLHVCRRTYWTSELP